MRQKSHEAHERRRHRLSENKKRTKETQFRMGDVHRKKRLMHTSCAFAAEHHAGNLQKPAVSYGWFPKAGTVIFDCALLPSFRSAEPAVGAYPHMSCAEGVGEGRTGRPRSKTPVRFAKGSRLHGHGSRIQDFYPCGESSVFA